MWQACHCLHFTGEESEAERWNHLLKDMQQVTDGVGIDLPVQCLRQACTPRPHLLFHPWLWLNKAYLFWVHFIRPLLSVKSVISSSNGSRGNHNRIVKTIASVEYADGFIVLQVLFKHFTPSTSSNPHFYRWWNWGLGRLNDLSKVPQWVRSCTVVCLIPKVQSLNCYYSILSS